jgi:periplasmic copper chaperone A
MNTLHSSLTKSICSHRHAGVRPRFGAAMTGAAWLLAATVTMADVVVHDAWMGAVPPTSKVAAVYLVVENTGPAAVQIGAAFSSSVPRIELHQSVHDDGRVRMEERQTLELAPGEKLDFSVTGHHYMLYFVDAPVPSPGERLELTLAVPGSGPLVISAEVRRPGEDGADAHAGHDHAAHEHGHHRDHDHSQHEHGHHHDHSQHGGEHGGH